MGRNRGFGKKHLTVEEKKKIVKSYRKGKTAIELAEIFGIQRATIHRWIREEESGRKLNRKTNPGSGRFFKINEKSVRKLIKIINNQPLSLALKIPYGIQEEYKWYVRKNWELRSPMCLFGIF